MTDERPRPRSTPHPESNRAVSAARRVPLRTHSPRLSKERLKDGAADTALNILAILRETWEDFRNADRFFKYKAAIIAGWAVLSVTSIFVACPKNEQNDIGARLVIAGDASRPVYMIKNEGEEAWTEVTVVVNGVYRAAVAQIAPNGDVTLTPKQLLGPDGALAPADLTVRQLELRTAQGNVALLQGGKPP